MCEKKILHLIYEIYIFLEKKQLLIVKKQKKNSKNWGVKLLFVLHDANLVSTQNITHKKGGGVSQT